MAADSYHPPAKRVMPPTEPRQLVRECLTRDWQEEDVIVRWCQRVARRVVTADELRAELGQLVMAGLVEAHRFPGETRPRYRTALRRVA